MEAVLCAGMLIVLHLVNLQIWKKVKQEIFIRETVNRWE